jgi:CRISPR type III-B/RAMP module RAMP protein Cmr1
VSQYKRLRISIEFNTPCFLAGADQRKDTAVWRAASIRGQLRWWLRALAPGSIDDVRSAEVDLLGSTAQKSTVMVRTAGAQPSVEMPGPEARFGEEMDGLKIADLWAEAENQDAIERIRLRRGRTNPIHYLGYGCMTWNKGTGSVNLNHPMIRPGQTAAFVLQWRGDVDTELTRRVLWAWLNLGGIGAKSRNGFGSMRVVRTAGLHDEGLSLVPRDRDDFVARAAAICRQAAEGCHDDPPEWSRFSPKAQILVSRLGAGSWEEALMNAGAWLIAFRRRYGYPRDNRDVGGNRVANRDYVWAKPGPDHRRGIPERAGFGLPLPFSKYDVVTWGDSGHDIGDQRRASPLHIHVARFGSAYHSVWTYLPARLIPRGSQLRFKNDKRGQPPSTRHQTIIEHFLADLTKKRLIAGVAP